MELISRDQARAKGLTHFYTGKPCKHGHVAKRYVSSGGCKTCTMDSARSWQSRSQRASNRGKTEAQSADVKKHNTAKDQAKNAPKYPIVTRAEAHKRGYIHFFTGEPCKHGHVSTRLVSTGRCDECQYEYDREYASRMRVDSDAVLFGNVRNRKTRKARLSVAR